MATGGALGIWRRTRINTVLTSGKAPGVDLVGPPIAAKSGMIYKEQHMKNTIRLTSERPSQPTVRYGQRAAVNAAYRTLLAFGLLVGTVLVIAWLWQDFSLE